MGSNNPEQKDIVEAITFPTRSVDNGQTAPAQPRQPKNLQVKIHSRSKICNDCKCCV